MSIVGSNALAGASGQAGAGAAGFKIERSLRFNDGDSAYLSKTPSSAGNRKTWTWSGWVKRTTFGTEGGIFSTYGSAHPNTSLFWESDGLKFHDYTSSYHIRLGTTAKYRDPSAWYHIVLAYDSTQSTVSDRAKLWVNGTLQALSGTTVPANHQTDWNSATEHNIGRFTAYFDGYMAEVHFVDGTALAATDFGEEDDNGVWQAKEFEGSHNTALPKHQGDWVGDTTGTAYSSGTSLDKSFDGDDSTGSAPQSGTAFLFTPSTPITGITKVRLRAVRDPDQSDDHDFKLNNTNIGSNWTAGGGVAEVEFTVNNLTSIQWATKSNGHWYRLYKVEIYYDGAYHTLTQGVAGVNGFRLDFSDTTSSTTLAEDSSGNNNGWSALNITAVSPGDANARNNFNVITYTGNGSTTRSHTSVGFQPDLIWIKCRSTGYHHRLFDVARGFTTGKVISSNLQDVSGSEVGDGNGYVSAVSSSGFTTNGSNSGGPNANQNNQTYVAWCWKGGGTAVSNTDGTITSSVSANPSYGFSVVKWTGDGTNANKTVGHGLSSAPKMVILKPTSEARAWLIWHTALNDDEAFLFDNGQPAGNRFGPDAPTSSVFGVYGGQGNRGTTDFIAYCFSDVTNYQKIGSYIGNGSSTGPVITTGFKPRFLLVKPNKATTNWWILDNERSPSSPHDEPLYPNSSLNEDSNNSDRRVYFDADGFQLNSTSQHSNESGTEYIYLAIGDKPDSSGDDSLIDTPTNYTADSGNGGNYATINPLQTQNYSSGSPVIANGNLEIDTTGTGWSSAAGTIAVSSGKYYWEYTCSNLTGSELIRNGIFKQGGVLDGTGGDQFTSPDVYNYASNAQKWTGSGFTSYGATYTTGDVIGVALDLDAGTLTFYKNGVSQGSAYTGLSGTFSPYFSQSSDPKSIVNFGARPFAHTPPSNHLALVTTNLSDPTIADGSTAFEAVLYTGNGSSQTISGLNHSPDLVWVKNRSSGDNHALTDTVRGATKWLLSNGNNAELTYPQALTAFTSDGFSVGSDDNFNRSTSTFVGWTWDGGDLATNSAYVQSEVWSDGWVLDSGSSWISGPKLSFDGVTGANTTQTRINGGATWTAGTSIAFTTLRIWGFDKGSAGGILVNGTDVSSQVTDGTTNAEQWNTITGITSPLSTIRITGTTSYTTGIGAVEVDGKILVDPGLIPAGGLNSSVYNTSDKWSDDLAGATYGGAGMPKSRMFNGTLTQNVIANSGTSLTFSPSGFSSISSLRIYGNSYTRNANGITVNGTDYTSSFPQGGGSVATWVTIPETSLTSVVWSTTGSGLENGSLYAIEVDGKLLVDNDQTPPSVPAVASTVRVNQSAGFSIVKVDDPTATESRAHGLNKKPDLIICKSLASADSWHTYHSSLGYTKYINLHGTGGATSSDQFGSQEPDSNLFYVKANTGSGANKSGGMIYYIWTAVDQYSAFGSFQGNGNNDGTFVFTGFKIAFLLIKKSSGSDAWLIWDNARQDFNAQGPYLQPQSNTTEGDADYVDFLSNGFKWRTTNSAMNASGSTYIYAAFAQNPLSLNGGLAG